MRCGHSDVRSTVIHMYTLVINIQLGSLLLPSPYGFHINITTHPTLYLHLHHYGVTSALFLRCLPLHYGKKKKLQNVIVIVANLDIKSRSSRSRHQELTRSLTKSLLGLPSLSNSSQKRPHWKKKGRGASSFAVFSSLWVAQRCQGSKGDTHP